MPFNIRLDESRITGLFRLPLELREKIYLYVLPHSIHRSIRYQEQKGFNCLSDWRRGHVIILRVCKQMHSEAVELLYGRNVFTVFIGFDYISLKIRWAALQTYKKTSTWAFLNKLSQTNLLRIHQIFINVEHVDSYQGMIKYNYSGPGLTHGLKMQVGKLVKAFNEGHQIRHMSINLEMPANRKRHPEAKAELELKVHELQIASENLINPQSVLDPLLDLGSEIDKLDVFGSSESSSYLRDYNRYVSQD